MWLPIWGVGNQFLKKPWDHHESNPVLFLIFREKQGKAQVLETAMNSQGTWVLLVMWLKGCHNRSVHLFLHLSLQTERKEGWLQSWISNSLTDYCQRLTKKNRRRMFHPFLFLMSLFMCNLFPCGSHSWWTGPDHVPGICKDRHPLSC